MVLKQQKKGLFPSTKQLVSTTSVANLFKKRLAEKQKERTKEIAKIKKMARKGHLTIKEEIKKAKIKPKYKIRDLSNDMDKEYHIFIDPHTLGQFMKGKNSPSTYPIEDIKKYLGDAFPDELFYFFFENQANSLKYEHSLFSDIIDAVEKRIPNFLPKGSVSDYQFTLKSALDLWGQTKTDEVIEDLVLTSWELVTSLDPNAAVIASQLKNMEKFSSEYDSLLFIKKYHDIFEIMKHTMSYLFSVVDDGSDLKHSSYRFQTYNQLKKLTKNPVQDRAILNLDIVVHLILATRYDLIELMTDPNPYHSMNNWVPYFLSESKRRIKTYFNSHDIKFVPLIFK